MAITAAGLYGLTLEKFLTDAAGENLEAEDNEGLLCEDGYTPNYDTHDFVNDVTNEISGGNYAREAITTTEITLSSGTLTFDAADTVYDNGGADDVTITNAMAQVIHTNVGADTTDQLVCLQDFVTAGSSTNSTFTVQHAAGGIFTIDYTP
ncbi:MAG: hypothetical protein DWQ40_00460 [Actinobacteria bacterium]|nr:MAG: hypothetical protein DWQ40_00460 [Actinomycetota bacterium]REK34103.1 MAG: hypothetical protein DWQ20_07030 [Actinomycetota bacterium]